MIISAPIFEAYLKFGERFEKEFLSQGLYEDRTIEATLDIGWKLMAQFDKSELTRVKTEFIEKHYKLEK